MKHSEIYSLEQQQLIADEVMTAGKQNALRNFILKPTSINRFLSQLNKRDTDRAKINFNFPNEILLSADGEEIKPISNMFALNEERKLLKRNDFATSLFSGLEKVTRMIHIIGRNLNRKELLGIKSISLDPNSLKLPLVVGIKQNELNKDVKCNVIFTLYSLNKIKIIFRRNEIQIYIDSDCFVPVQMHEMFLNTGIVRAYRFDSGKLIFNSMRELKLNEPLDFVRSTNNIVCHAKSLQKMQDFWRESIVSQESNEPFTEATIGDRQNRTITYTVVLQNLKKSRNDILQIHWKRLFAVADHFNISKFNMFELGVFNDLTTKLTQKELVRVINWYRQNKDKIPAASSSKDLYRRYILVRFTKNIPLSSINSEDQWRFYTSFYDYLRLYKEVMHHKVQIDYYSLDRFFAEELIIVKKYNVKKKKDYRKPFTINSKWIRLKKNIKNNKNIVLLDTPLKLVTEGNVQHNCVGTYDLIGRKEKSAFLEFTYGGLVHTVQINYDKKSDQYIIVQMFSTMNQPNAKGAKENLQKIINKR